MGVNEIILGSLRRYCSYRERCHSEVRSKLLSLKVYGDELESVISQLIEEDFLNEERYARSYCSGKHRIKKWGRHKIINGLKRKRINNYCIKKGLQEIDSEEYLDNLHQLLLKKLRLYDKEEEVTLKRKLISFAMRKGYSYEEIKSVMPEIN